MYNSEQIHDNIATYRVETLDPILFTLQNEYWKATKLRCIVACSFTTASIVLFLVSSHYPSGSYVSLFFGICATLAAVIALTITAYTHTRYTLFQKKLTSILIHRGALFIQPDAHIIDKWFISQRDFNESNLFYITPDTYSGNSLLDCFVNDIHVRFSFVTASYFIKRHIFRMPSLRSISLFNGVCTSFTLPTPQNTEYYCVSRTNPMLSIDIATFEKVTHLATEFNDNYTLLTSDMHYNNDLCEIISDLMLDIEEETGISCMLSLIGRKLFIAFPDPRLQFVTSFSGKLLYNRSIDKYLFILHRILQFANDFARSGSIAIHSK